MTERRAIAVVAFASGLMALVCTWRVFDIDTDPPMTRTLPPPDVTAPLPFATPTASLNGEDPSFARRAPSDQVVPSEEEPTAPHALPCSVPLATPVVGTVDFWEFSEKGMRHSLGRIRDGMVWIEPLQDSGRGSLTIPGQQSVPIEWSILGGDAWCDGRVREAVPRPFVITGRALPTADNVLIVGCGGSTRPEPDGAFVLETEDSPCDVRALRFHGTSTAVGPAVRAQADDDIALEVPPFEPAGIGVTYEPGTDGMRIISVAPDGPAGRRGLGVGDVITSIDGESLVGMASLDAAALICGPEGTSMSVGVLSGHDLRMVVLHREFVDHWWTTRPPVPSPSDEGP